MQEEGWVVCRAFKKRSTGQTKTINEGWDSTYYYEESTGVSSIAESIDYIARQHQQPQPSAFLAQNLICKQEIEATESLHFVQSDQFVQLPQLESPSLPQIKRPSSTSIATETNNNEEDHASDKYMIPRGISSSSKKVTDWRDLDKFVASQLSHGDGYDGVNVVGPSFESGGDSDFGLLLLQSGREEGAGPKLSELSTTSDCDFGICIFNK
ncbi:UNVERIFIED_CONTAM: NAC domain-containing protein 37 [Sesamum radiatum]|uniref:NAC domain-containing protein 37 n=1 Tax=Sesamum radiatum TaxID=300843 RepID=A0AAW2RGT3_SESRA